VNGQALICTNSSEQSQIAYKAIREFAMQVDPTCSNRMGGKYFRMTRNGLNWQPGHPMKGEIKCMAAGKTSKDGLYASVVHADEHGQAGYVNAHSDMQAAVDTCWGSTGPRREKLLLHTTTAGRIKEGPYKTKLEQVEASLLHEMQYPLGHRIRTSDDYWCAFLLQLDKWELTDDLTKLDDPELFKKVNRSIGTTVQPTYYRERLHEAATGTEDTKQEVLTKDFNMWQTGRIQKWVSPDEIRSIQGEWPTGVYKCPRRIDDCTADQGWEVMVGSDFSKGDDLNGNSYLAKRWREDLQEMEYFADLDAYMSEAAVNDSPIRALLMKWAEEGWLHIVPGKTFDPAVAVNRIIELDAENVNFFGFGYDPYNAKNVINALTQWLVDVGLDPKTLIKPVRQNFATYSPAVKEFDYMIHRGIQAEDGRVEPNPMIHLSENPLWPWEFGNCQLAESTDGMENMKPVKANSSQSCKVDNVQMLLSALILHDMADGSIQPG
jgi:phage terminase large subunit-like protein